MNTQPIRLHIVAKGLVQGVGFRPVVYRLATQLGLVGWVNNSNQGAVVEIEGERSRLQEFLRQLPRMLPAPGAIHDLAIEYLSPLGYSQFSIRSSGADKPEEQRIAAILPDLATCPTCLEELLNPKDRRYHYPFINCTHCGPRFSIIQGLPYDRPNTTMSAFHLCEACNAEYITPTNRRFHAQPNACTTCGPALSWWSNSDGKPIKSSSTSPLQQAVTAIRAGQIVALKGLGGFQLLVDAQNETAIARLRQRKHRPDKPFAVMYPSLSQVELHCEVSLEEADTLRSPQAPIVLLRRRWNEMGISKRPHRLASLASNVAPANPNIGVMLPYTPLHHLLMRELNAPVVATSGNLSGEPLCITDQEAFAELSHIADGFLTHNRPIQRPVDDSVVRIVNGQVQVLRRARGYAPTPLLTSKSPKPYASVLAVGSHLKNAIALSINDEIFLSQHIGDLETPKTFQQFQKTIVDFESLYHCQPQAIACDLHPDYRSTHWAYQLAAKRQIPLIQVQHHYAHALACMVEHNLTAPTLAITWDGSGYGLDQSIWGGEILFITKQGFQRMGHLLPFRLPGSEIAIREPRRSAMGLLYACFGESAFQMRDSPLFQSLKESEIDAIRLMLTKTVNSPLTSSIGRLFDGISALLGLHQTTSFEAQAAMGLEFKIINLGQFLSVKQAYPFNLISSMPTILDWRPMLIALIQDISAQIPRPIIAQKFHNTLIQSTIEILLRLYAQGGPETIVLSGGCFHNRYLLERLVIQLEERGFSVVYPQKIPTSDGGIAIGQIAAAWREPLAELDHSAS